MIKISRDFDNIAEKHYQGVSDRVGKVINFYWRALDLDLKKRNDDMTNDDIDKYLRLVWKELEGKKMNSFLNALFTNKEPKKEYKVTKKQYKHAFENNLKPEIESNTQAWKNALGYLSNHYKKIIISKPDELLKIVGDIKQNHPIICSYDSIFKEMLENIFDYESFKNAASWNAYELCKALNITVCPYCNRQYIFTIDEETKKVRPELDHFFKKSEYSLLAISFYNLIPSCSLCNGPHGKHATGFDLDNYFHPYQASFGSIGTFNFEAEEKIDLNSASQYFGNLENISISLKKNGKSEENKKIENHDKVFNLSILYEKHIDIVEEIYIKYKKYYFKNVKDMAQTFNLKGYEADMYRIAFGNYYNESDFEKRPLAKFTRDIFEDCRKKTIQK